MPEGSKGGGGRGRGRKGGSRRMQRFLELQPAAGLINAYLLVKQADNLQLLSKYRKAKEREMDVEKRGE